MGFNYCQLILSQGSAMAILWKAASDVGWPWILIRKNICVYWTQLKKKKRLEWVVVSFLSSHQRKNAGWGTWIHSILGASWIGIIMLYSLAFLSLKFSSETLKPRGITRLNLHVLLSLGSVKVGCYWYWVSVCLLSCYRHNYFFKFAIGYERICH